MYDPKLSAVVHFRRVSEGGKVLSMMSPCRLCFGSCTASQTLSFLFSNEGYRKHNLELCDIYTVHGNAQQLLEVHIPPPTSSPCWSPTHKVRGQQKSSFGPSRNPLVSKVPTAIQ